MMLHIYKCTYTCLMYLLCLVCAAINLCTIHVNVHLGLSSLPNIHWLCSITNHCMRSSERQGKATERQSNTARLTESYVCILVPMFQ